MESHPLLTFENSTAAATLLHHLLVLPKQTISTSEGQSQMPQSSAKKKLHLIESEWVSTKRDMIRCSQFREAHTTSGTKAENTNSRCGKHFPILLHCWSIARVLKTVERT